MNRDEKRNRDAALPGLTVQRKVPTVWMQAGLSGTLEIDASTNCLVVRTPMGTGASTERLVDIDVAWSPGWSVALRDGTPALIDANGQVACRLGDQITVGGGFIETSRIGILSCTGKGRVFEASELTRT
ncbi:hypothetical protein JOF29_007063 [Kribbella aluminosa]|uniref:Uncharacterized protein n=1 Tax=Kribbella aluminosa TaxID=416017 RepID=A0ABS4UWB8_9ACTN|nr:hypothetical protein [Kribbella aluminosa]MBP2355953.1 hypothetical protein [Kribbella aluminosa]